MAAKKKAMKTEKKEPKQRDPYQEILEIMDEYYDGTPPRTVESVEE